MNDITIEGTQIQEALEEALPKLVKDELTSSYSTNPLKKIIEEEISNQEGEIRKFVKGIMASALGSEEFKTRLSDEVIAAIIEKGLSR